jgi:hypothetical protein
MNEVRWDHRDGDLLRNNRTGALRQVVGVEFTKRFMDAQDHEMVAHGMGEYAGSYGGALRTMPLDDISGRFGQGVYTMKTSDVRRSWTNLTAQAEREKINEAS